MSRTKRGSLSHKMGRPDRGHSRAGYFSSSEKGGGGRPKAGVQPLLLVPLGPGRRPKLLYHLLVCWLSDVEVLPKNEESLPRNLPGRFAPSIHPCLTWSLARGVQWPSQVWVNQDSPWGWWGDHVWSPGPGGQIHKWASSGTENGNGGGMDLGGKPAVYSDVLLK